MDYVHAHNLVEPELAAAERPFGIRVTLPPNDAMQKVLGSSWERLHWYRSELDRDKAFENMATKHGYYRDTDSPTQILEKVTR